MNIGNMADPRDIFKEEFISHTFRLPIDMDERMKFRARQKYHGNIQAYILSLVIQDVTLPDLPDCNTCGFRHMGEFLLNQLRKDR